MTHPGSHKNVNGWGVTLYSTPDGTRPVAGMGTAVTPGNNAYGSYVTLISGANLTVDCLLLEVCINNVGITTLARDCVVSLGVDSAGGTAFVGIADLVAGPASSYVSSNVGQGGTMYRFPIWIRAGSSIGVAAAVNSTTLTAINVFCRVRGAPSTPQHLYVGTYIDQYGVTLATSSGTAFTPGTTAEGAWTSLGTLSRPASAFEFGIGVNDATMTSAALDVDVGVGDATNKKIVIANLPIATSAIETISKPPALEFAHGAIGDQVWIRAQSSGALDSSYSAAIYAVGG